MSYSEILLDNFEHPRNPGNPAPDDTGRGIARWPVCGDLAAIFVKVEGGRVVRFKHKVTGCGVALACASMYSTLVVGKTVEEALAITPDQLSDELGGITPTKMHAAQIVVAAARSALTNNLLQSGGEAP